MTPEEYKKRWIWHEKFCQFKFTKDCDCRRPEIVAEFDQVVRYSQEEGIKKFLDYLTNTGDLNSILGKKNERAK
jgi:hypothetical protein